MNVKYEDLTGDEVLEVGDCIKNVSFHGRVISKFENQYLIFIIRSVRVALLPDLLVVVPGKDIIIVNLSNELTKINEKPCYIFNFRWKKGTKLRFLSLSKALKIFFDEGEKNGVTSEDKHLGNWQILVKKEVER